MLSNAPATTGAQHPMSRVDSGEEKLLQTLPSPSPASVLLTASLAVPLPAGDVVTGDTVYTQWGCSQGRGAGKISRRVRGTNIKVKGLDFC